MKTIIFTLLLTFTAVTAQANDMQCESSDLYSSRLDLPNGDAIFYKPMIVKPDGTKYYLDLDRSNLHRVCVTIYGFNKKVNHTSEPGFSDRYTIDIDDNIVLGYGHPDTHYVTSITCSKRY